MSRRAAEHTTEHTTVHTTAHTAEDTTVHAALRAALLTALSAFVLYAATCAPTITEFDAGDLITASWTGGVAHPPGYPFYSALGFVFAHLVPLGGIAFRYNLFSAVAAAIAVGVTTATATLLCGEALAAAIAVAVFAVSGVWWSQAVVAEVYALHGALVAVTLGGMTWWVVRRDARGVWVAAWAFGVGLAHHLSLGLLAPGIAACILLARREAPWRWRWIAPLAGLLALGPLWDLSILLHARLEPAYDFSHPSTWPRLLSHLRGAMYTARLVAPGSAEWWHRLGTSVPAITHSLTWPAALLGAVGLGVLVHRHRPAGVMFAMSGVAFALYTAMYRIPDIEVYYLPVHLLLALGLAVSVAHGYRLLLRWRLAPGTARGALVACALVPAALLARGWAETNHHAVVATRDYLQAAGDIATDGGTRPATLFLDGDTELFGLFYLHLVEGRWPGLVLIDRNGTLGPDVYGLRASGHMVLGFNTETRQRAEAAYLASTPARVYYMPAPSSLPPGYVLKQRGLIFEALAESTTRDPQHGDPWNWVAALDPAHAPAGPAPHDVRNAYAQVALLRGTWDLAHARTGPALALLHRAELLAPDEPEALATLARLYLAAGDTARAMALSRRGIAHSAFTPQAETRHADMLLLAGDSTGALAAYEHARASGGGLDAIEDIRLANLYALRNEWPGAIDGYTRALQRDPANADGWMALGSAQLHAGNRAAAQLALERAAQLRPASAAVQDNLGMAYAAAGDAAHAEAAFRRATDLEPASPSAWATLGAFWLDAQKLADADRAWRTVTRLAPDYPRAHLALGMLARTRGDLATAEAELRHELRLTPGDPRALSQLGYVALGRGDAAAAARDWRDALARDSQDVQTWLALGGLCQAQGNAAVATEAFQHVVELAPPDSPAARAARAALSALTNSGHPGSR